MLVSEVIQRIQALYSKGVASDDTRLSSRHIYNKILTVRARVLSQEAKKKQRLSQWNYQTIPCLKLIRVFSHECPCVEPVGCEILRSEFKLPRPLLGMNGELIKSVTTIERSLKIDEISINAINAQKGNKYTSNKINYFIYNDFLYFSAPYTVKLGAVSVVGLFEDPIEVKTYKGLCDDCVDCNSCIDYMEEEFPLDGTFVDMLVELSSVELIQIFSQAIEDTSNDTRDSLKEQSK